MTFPHLLDRFSETGCRQLYAKFLARNDNSKQQIYFGKGTSAALSLFPAKEFTAVKKPEAKRQTFHAELDFGWLLPNGCVSPAPEAKLILYPDYPEVRFSGFLAGAKGAPSDLLNAPREGRILFIGITTDRKLVGYVADAASQIAKEFCEKYRSSEESLFVSVALPKGIDFSNSRDQLLRELRRIHDLEWIDSKKLGADGKIKPCLYSNCGGYTLEAELGISMNGDAEPDFLGWEIKQHGVKNFEKPGDGEKLTLMTPEPTGGLYQDEGVAKFICRFGYPDKNGKPDRLNVGGAHRFGIRGKHTGLTLDVRGFDVPSGKLTDASGAVVLRTDSGEIAASWAFESLLTHWARKHANAAYIPSKMRDDPKRQYSYGHKVRLGCGTDPLRLLKGFCSGAVYYDPGIKLEGVSTSAPKPKRRSQFRIKSKDLSMLYERMDIVDVTV